MSADVWRDCPSCGTEDSVGVYGIFDINLTKDGRISNESMTGTCFSCKMYFRVMASGFFNEGEK